jgi:hypothetical protein
MQFDKTKQLTAQWCENQHKNARNCNTGLVRQMKTTSQLQEI